MLLSETISDSDHNPRTAWTIELFEPV